MGVIIMSWVGKSELGKKWEFIPNIPDKQIKLILDHKEHKSKLQEINMMLRSRYIWQLKLINLNVLDIIASYSFYDLSNQTEQFEIVTPYKKL